MTRRLRFNGTGSGVNGCPSIHEDLDTGEVIVHGPALTDPDDIAQLRHLNENEVPVVVPRELLVGFGPKEAVREPGFSTLAERPAGRNPWVNRPPRTGFWACAPPVVTTDLLRITVTLGRRGAWLPERSGARPRRTRPNGRSWTTSRRWGGGPSRARDCGTRASGTAEEHYALWRGLAPDYADPAVPGDDGAEALRRELRDWGLLGPEEQPRSSSA